MGIAARVPISVPAARSSSKSNWFPSKTRARRQLRSPARIQVQNSLRQVWQIEPQVLKADPLERGPPLFGSLQRLASLERTDLESLTGYFCGNDVIQVRTVLISSRVPV